MSKLDWAGLMRSGMHGLGLAPEVVWRLSPAELALMLGVEPGSVSMDRAKLEAMARAWPDRTDLQEAKDV